MGTMTAQNLMDRAYDLTQDQGVRWTSAEWLRWLSDAQRAVVEVRPDAHAVTANFLVTANVTKQTLPTAAIRLLDVTRNMGAEGTTPGAPIRLIERDTLDAHRPGWHAEAGALEVKHYLYDERNPRVFWLYKKPSTASYIELLYSTAPAEITSTATAIALDDLYANDLLNFMLHRAYMKDADFAPGVARAMAYLQAFNESLGIRTQADAAVTPKGAIAKKA